MFTMKDMSDKHLRDKLDEVDEERKLLMKRIRREGVKGGDAAEMNAMSQWAEQVFGEIMRRKGEPGFAKN